MTLVRDPVLHPVAILDLRPTQLTVGMREVEEKRKHLRNQPQKKIGKFLGNHMIPVIRGPRDRMYVIDHHHLSLALHLEGISNILVTVVADLSALEPEEFWTVLDHHNWMFPYDTEGRRRTIGDIPKSVTGLKDDPFRSLAGALRRAGGFAKDITPFSEFLWADFLRRRMKRKTVQNRFSRAVEEAMRLAKSQEAHHLPGWCGPIEA